MTKVLATAAVALLAALAAAQTDPAIQQISSRLTPNDLKADVSFLASDLLQGRGTPSPGLDIAAEYIAAQFRRAGLDPAGDDGYFQTALYGNVTPNVEGMEFTVETAGNTVKAHPESMALQQAFAADFSRSPMLKAMGSDVVAIAALTPGAGARQGAGPRFFGGFDAAVLAWRCRAPLFGPSCPSPKRRAAGKPDGLTGHE